MKFDLLRSRGNAVCDRKIKLVGGEDEGGRTLTGMEVALCGGVREPCAGHGPAQQDDRQPDSSLRAQPVEF